MAFRKLSAKERRELNRGTDPAKIAERMPEDTGNPHWQRSFAWVAKRVVAGSASQSEIDRFRGEPRKILQRMKRACRPEGRLAILAEYQQNVPGLAEALAAVEPDGPDPDALKTGADLIRELPQVLFLWNPWIPRGMITLVIAAPGIGKSAFAMGALARAVTCAGTWPDGKTSLLAPGKVLYVDTESGQAMLSERLQQWKLPAERIILPKSDDVLGTVKLDDPDDVFALRHFVQRQKPALVIIDSLRGSHSKAENDSRISGEILEALGKLAQESSAAIVVIHHTRKTEEGKTVTADDSRGSNALIAHARSVIAIDKPDPKSESVRVSVVKSNVAKFPEPFGFKFTKTGLTFGPAPRRPREEKKPSRGNEAEAFLLDFLANGPKPATEVQAAATKADISAQTLRRARKALGVITPRGGKSTWKLPPNLLNRVPRKN
jgi:AAA domain